MATKGVYQGNVRRGIYLPETLLAELTEYGKQHQISFNEVIRTAGLSLLELDRRGVAVRTSGVTFDGIVPDDLTA